MSDSALPQAAIPAGISTAEILTGGWAESHFSRQQKPVDAVATPLPGWNRHCRDAGGGVGLAKGWYVIVAGATGHGKTLMALNLAAHAVKEGVSVAYLSLEMDTSQLATRVYAILTNTDVRRIERGAEFDVGAAAAVTKMTQEIRENTGAGLHTNREPMSELESVLKLMGYFHAEHGVEWFVVDYLQLVSSGDEREIVQQVTRISHKMRYFARKLGVVVIGLSQFNRMTSANRYDSPVPQSLIGASALENDADQVLLLDHSRYLRAADGRTARTWAILGKNRHGSTGEIPIEWNYRTLQVREAMPDEEHEWPRQRGGP